MDTTNCRSRVSPSQLSSPLPVVGPHRRRRKSIFRVEKCKWPRRWEHIEDGSHNGRCSLCGNCSVVFVRGENTVEFCSVCAELVLPELIRVATSPKDGNP